MATIELERPAEALPELDEVSIVLLGAARIVRERWQQYRRGEFGEPRCARGALQEVASTWSQGIQAADRVSRSLGLGGDYLASWNDAPDRTAEEVAEAMERAAYGL